MIIGFSGHRDRTVDRSLLVALATEFPDALWIHGGAAGFDSQVHSFCLETGRTVEVIRPRYKEVPEGMSHAAWVRIAPLKRNDIIVERCCILVACYDGRRRGGTFYTVQTARNKGKTVRIWEPLR